MSEPVPLALTAGMIFHGRYEILRCLKAGGMGAVYECIHLKTRKHRALKVMLPQVVANAAMRARFELEARVTAEIESDHIVETFDAGVDEQTGAPFLVMELLRGADLAGIVEKKGPFGPEDTVLLLQQAALALDKTHAAGIVHRDLKPENLYLVSTDDGSPRLKILDFGIAKVMNDGSQTNRPTAAIGTPLYMSPEQVRGDGQIGPRADIYALGHIAFALLTGRAYWSEEQDATTSIFAFLSQMMNGVVEAPSARAARWGRSLPPAFDAWFVRATSPWPDQRFEKASALVAGLASALAVESQRPPLRATPMGGGALSGPVVAAHTPPAPPWVGGGAPPSQPQPLATMGALSNESRPRPATRASTPFFLVLGFATLAAAAGIYRWTHPGARDPVPEAREPAVAVTPSTNAPVVTVGTADTSSAADHPKAAPATQSEAVGRVTVGPPGVTVEIDDHAAAVENGAVELRGAPGSVHRVSLRKDGRATTSSVILSEAGPVPSSFDLGRARVDGPPSRPTVDPGARPVPATVPAVKPATTGDTTVSRKFE